MCEAHLHSVAAVSSATGEHRPDALEDEGPQDVWLHPEDAAARGIADGQRVRVYNDRGVTLLPARVTDRIARGVVCIKEGAWFTPDATGQDVRGSANVLTADRAAPSGATTYNTCLVEVEPADAGGRA